MSSRRLYSGFVTGAVPGQRRRRSMDTLTTRYPHLDATYAAPPLHPRPHVAGAPYLILRAEGAAVFALALLGYARLGSGWGLFAALLFLPDLALLGYLAGSRAGALAYNGAHSYVAPALVAAGGMFAPGALSLALIWAAHIGLDRALGYGLKYASGFGDTHLGRVGRKPGGVERA
jgi:hypothetical protein